MNRDFSYVASSDLCRLAVTFVLCGLGQTNSTQEAYINIPLSLENAIGLEFLDP